MDLTPRQLSDFWRRVDKSGECWVWIGFITPWGYGRPRIGGKNIRAHRLAYELLRGPIPDGLVIDHLCRNRACVNPDHLEAVTHKENSARSPFYAAVREAHFCKRGHPFTDENTEIQPSGYRRCRRCSVLRHRRYEKRMRGEPEWVWLYDDYERGTVFITDDPTGEQKPLVSGITEDEAKAILALINDPDRRRE